MIINRPLCALISVSLLLSATAFSADDDKAAIVSRFTRVEKWAGTISMSETMITRATGDKNCDDKIHNGRAYWEMNLKGEIGGGPNTNGWIYRKGETAGGHVSGRCTYSDVRNQRSIWHGLQQHDGGSGACEEMDASVLITDDKNPTYDVYGGAVLKRIQSHAVRLEREDLRMGWKQFPYNCLTSASYSAASFTRPIPSSLHLHGSRTEKSSNIYGSDCYDTSETTTVSWDLRPNRLSQYDVQVEIEGYQDWMPKAMPNGKTPGNKLVVRATLTDDKGNPAGQDAKKFIFELTGTSSEPGVAMNWPSRETAGTDLDLRMLPGDENQELAIKDDKGQYAETKKDGDSAAAVISSFDWGGHTFLHVTAVMADGEEVEGHLKGNGESAIPVPRREKGSDIASKWKEDNGVTGQADSDDQEDKPPSTAWECHGHKGDGLTLYEEYRGFYARKDDGTEGGHFRGDPNRKDYFIVNTLKGAAKGDGEQGIGLFQMESRLNVHSKLSEDEVSDRVINFNHGDAAHEVDQHAVIIKSDPAITSYAIARGGPGTPGKISEVAVGTGFHPDDWNVVTRGKAKILTKTFPAMIAHELLHAANVWHHGDRDKGLVRWEAHKYGRYFVVWETAVDVDTGEEDGAPSIVTVLAENGRQLNPELFKNPRNLWVGSQYGQHSGVEDCLMRYDIATAYDPDYPAGNTRYLIAGEKEMTGIELCRAVKGTGVNASSHQPRPRYGDADRLNDRGNCQTHICVNDLYEGEHPDRTAK